MLSAKSKTKFHRTSSGHRGAAAPRMNHHLDHRAETRLEALLRFFGPLVAAAVYIATLRLLLDDRVFSLFLAFMGVEFFPPFSLEVAVPVGYYLGLNPLAMILALTFQNAITAVFVIWNYHLLFHLPRVGIYFIRFREKMKKVAGRRQHASFLGLFLFFVLPFKGTGSMSMAFIGKLINMDEKKILAISIFGKILISAVIILSLTGIGIFAERFL